MKALSVDAFLAIVGVSLLLLAWNLSPYRDIEAFRSAQTLDIDTFLSPEEASDAYWKVREEQLTPKYRLQDYGATLLIVGLFLAWLRFAFRATSLRQLLSEVQTPALMTTWVLGVSAVLLQIARDYLVVLLSMHRNEVPPWADSPGVAWMGNDRMALLYVAFTLIVGVVGSYRYSRGRPISSLIHRPSSALVVWWIVLGPIVLIFALWTAFLVAVGGFEQLPATLCWLTFSLMLLAGKQMPANNKLQRPRGVASGRAGG